MKTIRKWFLSGIAVILPLGVTIYVLLWLFNLLDGILGDFVVLVLGRQVRGVGLLAIIILVFVAGVFTSNYVGKKIVGWFQKLIARIPIIKSVYQPITKIVSGFSGENTKSFQKVVTLDFPTKGIKSIGFITNDNISLNQQGKLCVFIPTTPNPTNGFLVLVDEKDVDVLDIPINEGLNLVVSLGSAIQGNIGFEIHENSLINDLDKEHE